MDEHRKRIILKEIKFWKENRMLPEQYCNYLLTIYSEGDTKDNLDKNGYDKLWALLGVSPFILAPLVTYLLYFTELSLNLQLLIYPTVLIFLIISAILLSIKKLIWRHITYIVIAIISLELIIDWVGFLTKLSPLMLGIVLFANCLIWILIGFLKKLTYFIYSGVSLIILYIGFMVYTL
ncbi:hypothetical protein [Gottfriedia luciferensis]|uniref:hypothetical protein n=1 Tax=Gottfriedia luciferensis TaxID=178774 RepID=UPI000B43836D|nr:hypothetical protein [Gottfriedia luciferensis]